MKKKKKEGYKRFKELKQEHDKFHEILKELTAYKQGLYEKDNVNEEIIRVNDEMINITNGILELYKAMTEIMDEKRGNE